MSIFAEILQCNVCGARVLQWNPSRNEQSAVYCADDNREMKVIDSGRIELSDLKEHEGKINSIDHIRNND